MISCAASTAPMQRGWAKKAGGVQVQYMAKWIAVDGSGNSYVTGYFATTATFGGQTCEDKGGNDISLAAKYGTDGTLAWAKQEGGTQ